MRPPLTLLDLFCGSGGAALGYMRAGFNVVGIDHRDMPRYPGEFIKTDALNYLRNADLSEYAAIHASPPCQPMSRSTSMERRGEPNLLFITRSLLSQSTKPWVIENVTTARWAMRLPIMLCGGMFGLEVQRHRLFEANFYLWEPHHTCTVVADVAKKYGVHQKTVSNYGKGSGPIEFRHKLMGIHEILMTHEELSQAIPPAYTEWIGHQMIKEIENEQ